MCSGIPPTERQFFCAFVEAKMREKVAYGPGDLDILSRAFYAVLDSIPDDGRDPEDVKAIVMAGILDAARQGERDEKKLMVCGLAALEKYENNDMDAVMHEAPL
jgi:hypothetical protein